MYTPGMMSDVVREVKEAARVREEALLNRVKAMVEERSWSIGEGNLRLMRDIEEVKAQIQHLRCDRKEANKRIAQLEADNKYMRSILSSILNNRSNNLIHENELYRSTPIRRNNNHELTHQNRASLNLNYGIIKHEDPFTNTILTSTERGYIEKSKSFDGIKLINQYDSTDHRNSFASTESNSTVQNASQFHLDGGNIDNSNGGGGGGGGGGSGGGGSGGGGGGGGGNTSGGGNIGVGCINIGTSNGDGSGNGGGGGDGCGDIDVVGVSNCGDGGSYMNSNQTYNKTTQNPYKAHLLKMEKDSFELRRKLQEALDSKKQAENRIIALENTVKRLNKVSNQSSNDSMVLNGISTGDDIMATTVTGSTDGSMPESIEQKKITIKLQSTSPASINLTESQNLNMITATQMQGISPRLSLAGPITDL